jgi:uncharacterized protein (DUF2267 family)
MTVELKPETERLVQEELQSGHVHTADELVIERVQALREKLKGAQTQAAPRKLKMNLAQFLLESPLRGSGLRLDRQKDYPRPVDL